MISTALVRIPVGVLVERRKASSPWADFLHRPVAVLPGVPAATPWTVVSTGEEDVATFYAGEAVIELHRTETAGYRDNLVSGAPSLWVSLRPAAQDRLEVLLVTADPAEGEALTGVGDDLVDTVPMPPAIHSVVADFVARHHVEHTFRKRQRDRSTPHADAGPAREREGRG